MYTPTSSNSKNPLDPDALRLLSLYTMLASLAGSHQPNSSLSYDTSATHSTNTGSPSSQAADPSLPNMTITIDASTNIIGHANTVQLPSTATTNDRITHLLEIAFKNLPDKTSIQDEDYDDDGYAVPKPMNVEVKVQAGVNICGSKNIVVLGGGGSRPAGQGVKRKAEGEGADAPQAKKTAKPE